MQPTPSSANEKPAKDGRPVLIVGAGGHALVVVDILARAHAAGSPWVAAGVVDDDPEHARSELGGIPVLGPCSRVGEVEHDAVIVAIGDNRVRARIFEDLKARGERLASAIHPTAVIAPDARVGEGVMVCAGVVVNPAATVGDNVILNTGCTVDHHNRIGDHAHVAPGVHLGGTVDVGAGALVGIGAAVIPGCSIGEWAVVGAGSTVIDDIPPRVTAVGIPARPVRRQIGEIAR